MSTPGWVALVIFVVVFAAAFVFLLRWVHDNRDQPDDPGDPGPRRDAGPSIPRRRKRGRR